MDSVMLTLHYPTGLVGMPIATTTDPQLLREFKRVVLEEWHGRVDRAGDGVEAHLRLWEYERLEKSLDLAIPGQVSND